MRAFHGMMSVLPKGLETLEQNSPFDVLQELKNSKFGKFAEVSEARTVESYKKMLEDFVCPVTNLKF